MSDQYLPERINSLLDYYNAEETTDEQRIKIEAELEELDLQLESLLESLKGYVVETEADLDYYKAWLKRKSETAKARVERVDKYIMQLMMRRKLTKIKAGIFTLALQESKFVDIQDAGLLSMEYVREKTIYEPDKLKLSKDLKEGKKISGAVLGTRTNLITK